MIIGIWANVEGKNYVSITDNTASYTEVSVLCIVVGLFVLILGIIGVVGGIFASTIFGRITLGLVSGHAKLYDIGFLLWNWGEGCLNVLLIVCANVT